MAIQQQTDLDLHKRPAGKRHDEHKRPLRDQAQHPHGIAKRHRKAVLGQEPVEGVEVALVADPAVGRRLRLGLVESQDIIRRRRRKVEPLAVADNWSRRGEHLDRPDGAGGSAPRTAQNGLELAVDVAEARVV